MIRWVDAINYGHDDFSIGLLRDTRPHVECYDVIYGAKHPFLWNHARFFYLLRPQKKDALLHYHIITFNMRRSIPQKSDTKIVMTVLLDI